MEVNLTHSRYYYVVVGSYGANDEQAIEILKFDSEEGSLMKIGSTTGIENPSFLTINRANNRLYSVSEVEQGEVVSYGLDLGSGQLVEMNRQKTQGSHPCYISLETNDGCLFAVNYGGGSINIFPLQEDGSIAPLSDVKYYTGSSIVEKHQEQSHPHAIVNIPNTNKFIVTDLGTDLLYVYELQLQTCKFQLVEEVTIPAGSGPRHLVVHPERHNIYVVHELNSSLSVFAYDEGGESLQLIQTIGTLTEEFDGSNYCADIHISPTGTHLYVSNRGHHSIATFEILNDGQLKLIGNTSTMGEWPRNFAIVPNGKFLLVANQHSNSIEVMKIPDDYVPTEMDRRYSVNQPVCLLVIPELLK
ncbi:lactonase family protein [Ferdinandcohnia quinoae]|uniref:Lactonase family protein n=1 Tax=Fredinandcohnia quinoae TaxID=2918902 RepID=A0AAW5E3K5_9BACI|nr:lactonase family protein [Fredinandcohnia sp. SECRCQ15]MCH1624130.1 lactonase family protein [Fredinandcohnia sp. SECRCQ15]